MKGFKKLARRRRVAVILLGRPGSGKDTQAELLVKKFGFVHLISSNLIEKALALKKKSPQIESERRRLHDGRLVTFDFVVTLVKKEIKRIAAQKHGLIMSGSPRSKLELKKEWPLLKKLYGKDKIFIFHIDISPEEVYVRNSKRHRKDLPELDTKKIIKKRLEAFNLYTLPVIKFLEKQKKIIKINGEQSIMKIHKDILWQLQSKLEKK